MKYSEVITSAKEAATTARSLYHYVSAKGNQQGDLEPIIETFLLKLEVCLSAHKIIYIYRLNHHIIVTITTVMFVFLLV